MAKFLVHVVRCYTEVYAVEADDVCQIEDLDISKFNARDPLRSIEAGAFIDEIHPTRKKEIREEIRLGDNAYTSLVLAEKGSDLSDVIWDIR
jgi:hypothetical protein